jgi:hypothetical protein
LAMPNRRSAAEDFAEWAHARVGLEPDVVDTLVQFKGNCLGDPSDTRWTREGLRTLLLEWLPRKVTADDEWVGATVPTMRSYIRFLRETGRLHREADPAGMLLDELDVLESEYPVAMRDRSRFGMAKSLFAIADDDGVDLTDETAVQGWVQRFNARPLDERRAATDPHLPGAMNCREDEGPPQSVPAVRLPSRQVLAEIARSSVLVADVARLAAWVGDRKQVTQTGVLRLEDAYAAVDELGLLPGVGPDPQSGAAGNPRPRMRSARDIRSLQMLWALAVESGFVTVSRTTACEGRAMRLWVEGQDEGVLEAWREVFEVVVEMGADYGLERRYQPPLFEQVEETVLGVFPDLYVGERTTVAELVADMADNMGVPEAAFGEPLNSWVDREVRDLVERLVDVGVLARDDDAVAMTPLGRWVVREQLLEAGTDAPVVGDVTAMDAAQMLDEVGRLWSQEAEHARREWLTSRPSVEAARDLVSAGCQGSALARVAVLGILEADLDDVAEAVLAAVVDHERFGPHARMWLAEHAGADPAEWLSEEQIRSLTLDGIAALLQAMPPECTARDLPEDVWRLAEACLPSSDEQPVGDDDAIGVYDAIGVAHPRGRVRKAAKKAAHKARQSRAQRATSLVVDDRRQRILEAVGSSRVSKA